MTKSCQQFFRRKTDSTQFWPEIFHFFEQDRLLFAGVEIGVTEFPKKTAKEEEEEENVSEIFQKRVRIPILKMPLLMARKS